MCLIFLTLQGKHMPWDNAQAKTAAASKEAHDAEVYACKAHKHLESVGDSQQESERARDRLAEVNHLTSSSCH